MKDGFGGKNSNFGEGLTIENNISKIGL